ncbi:MAG: serine hydrolase [Oscillospiraceae bacterium]|jgi:D-alanyl-D-alanine carboxypeptidase (penicillin-binding protein 5/6)|nr:serine hydrolase [Oscillospiraceae bacterium]
MEKLKALSILSLAALFFTLSAPALAAPPEDFRAEAVYLSDASTGETLYEKNADVRRGPDALVKIMTLLLAAEAVERGEVSRSELITASDSAFFDIKGDVASRSIASGETLPFIDLLYCAFIGGYDEACNIIAERVSGNSPDFIEAMNERAAALGCENTRFVNTHGALSDAQYSTARDLSIIVREASKNALFTEVSTALSYTVRETNSSPARRLVSVNYMLVETRARYYYKYAVFGRTSATYENGYGCVELAEREEFSAVAVVLGAAAVILEDESTEMQNLTETRRLFEWGFANYTRRAVLSSTELVARAEVAFGSGADYVNLRPDRDISLLLPVELPENELTRGITIYSDAAGAAVSAPVAAGDVLGEITISRGGEIIARAELVADASVPLLHAKFIRQRVTDALGSRWAKIVIIVAAVLFLGYVIIVVRYNILRARRVRQMNDAKQRIADNRRRSNRED